MEKQKISPEEIMDNTIVENFTYAFNPQTGNKWTIHTEIQFFRFNKMIYELIDNGFISIKEISLEEYSELAIKFHNTNFPLLNTVSKVQSFTEAIHKRKNSL